MRSDLPLKHQDRLIYDVEGNYVGALSKRVKSPYTVKRDGQIYYIHSDDPSNCRRCAATTTFKIPRGGKKRGNPVRGVAVRCVNTGQEFISIKAASDAVPVSKSSIIISATEGVEIKGYLFEYI